jgi:hypothetical protein
MIEEFRAARASLEAALACAGSLHAKAKLLRYAFTLQTAQANLMLSIDGAKPVRAYVSERFEGDIYVRVVGELDTREGCLLLQRQGLAINPGRRSGGTVELYPLEAARVKPVVDAEVLRVYLECAYWKATAHGADPHSPVASVLRKWVAAVTAQASAPELERRVAPREVEEAQ